MNATQVSRPDESRRTTRTVRPMIDLKRIELAPVDYWYDLDYLEVRRLVDTMSADEWRALEDVVPTQGSLVQERIAYVLNDVEHPPGVRILLRMCASADRDAALAARESLRQLPPALVHETAEELFPRGTPLHAAIAASRSTNAILDLPEFRSPPSP